MPRFVNWTGKEIFIRDRVTRNRYTSFKPDESRLCDPLFACMNGSLSNMLKKQIKFVLKNDVTYHIVTKEMVVDSLSKEARVSLFIPESAETDDDNCIICNGLISV